jgi:hypothetical protein
MNQLKDWILTYMPLMVVTFFALLLSAVFFKNINDFIYLFMGFFLVIFSLFKWIDLQSFMQAFSLYDLVSKKFKAYLWIFPLLELVLGLNYLSQGFLLIGNSLVVVIMSINAISIGKAIYEKKKIFCACLGGAIKLPLSKVSLFETLVMLVMAAMMI